MIDTTSQIKPVAIFKVDDYGPAQPTISALTLGGETVYIWNTLNPQYFTELKDAVTAVYQSAITERDSYKKVCHARDCADAIIKRIREEFPIFTN
jgi:hypothetical protein